MTGAYHEARQVIKRHVKAGPEDVLMLVGSGMTEAINKFQSILGIRIPERFKGRFEVAEAERPVVFVSQMEHHSNHISWKESIA
jgi:selenocysteine lyase/cysteine desulfurase